MECLLFLLMVGLLSSAIYFALRTHELAQRISKLEEKVARLEQPTWGMLPAASAYLNDLYTYIDQKG